MTPFLQLRRWLKDGPGSERFCTLVAGVVAVLLVAWAVLPTTGSPDGGSAAAEGVAAVAEPSAGAGAGASAAGTPGAAAPPIGASVDTGPAPAFSSSAGSAPAGTSAGTSTGGSASGPAAPAQASATSGGSGCDNRATDKGVTANQVLIGVIIYTLGEANPALGIPPADDIRKMHNAVFDHYNKQGGIQCRKLVPKFYEEFVLDSSSGHAECLKMQQDGVFAVLNSFSTVQNRNCIPQAGIPNFWALSPDTATVRQFHPFVMSFQADYDRLYRDYVFGAQHNRFFDGMKKLGVLEQTCYPNRVTALRANLTRIGIGADKIDSFNFGCPATIATADQFLAAAIQFRRSGVTHVMSAYREAAAGFADRAQAQGYRPKYALLDDQFSSLLSNGNPPPPDSLDGSIIITKSQEGAEYTPGATFTQATRDCEAITKSAGLPGPTSTGSLAGSLHALACINTKMIVEAGKRTSPLTRRGLAAGLAKVGKLDLSFPAGPADFRDPAVPIGAQFWRTAVYRAECNCVKLLDATWRPEFR